MMKRIKWILLLIIGCILFLLIPSGPLLALPYFNSNVYESWMSETIDDSRSILDIAMPGAHDAFTSNFSYQSSADPGMIKQGDTIATLASTPYSFLYRSILLRYSKTQESNLYTLLYHGVRYFDIRLTYTGEGYYTTHGFLGEPFEPLLDTLNEFLATHPGEIVLLHFQHVFDERNDNAIPSATTWSEINEMLSNSHVLDRVYEVGAATLSSLTYGSVTNNGLQSKVILIGDNRETITHPNWLSGPDSLRSTWHDTIETSLLLEGIVRETEYVNDTPSEYQKFRVLQGQKTAQLSSDYLFSTFMNWSLLDAARTSNQAVLSMPQWDSVIHATPILMFDAIDHNDDGFYETLMERVIAYNQ